MSFRGQPTNKLERSPWSRMKPLVSTSSDSVQREIPPLSLPLQELGFHVMYIILYYIYIYKPNSTPPPDVPLQGLGWRPSTYIIYICIYIYIYIYICIYIYIVCVCVCVPVSRSWGWRPSKRKGVAPAKCRDFGGAQRTKKMNWRFFFLKEFAIVLFWAIN